MLKVIKKSNISREELIYIVNAIKKGHRLQFTSRSCYNKVNNYMNDLKLSYYIDNINKAIWL